MRERRETSSTGPLTSVLRHPALVTACLVTGLVLGLLAALAAPRTYTAETRLAVVPANTNAYTVAGYPVGARELAADYARWVQNRATDGAWSAQGVDTVTASPIPDSAVIRIEAEGGDRQAALQGADAIAQQLVSTVGDAKKAHDPEAAYAQFQSFTPKVAQARSAVAEAERAYGRAQSTAARTRADQALRKAQADLAAVQLRQDAAGDLYRRLYVDTAGNSTLKVVAPASSQGDPLRTALMRYGIVGLGAGALLGLLLAVLADRRRERRAAVRHGGASAATV